MGRLILGLCATTLLGCGSTSHPDRGRSSDGGGGFPEGGAGGSTVMDAGGASVGLSLNVVQRASAAGWLPAPGAHVRFEGANSSFEVLSDEVGHVEARALAESGPWDITVALAGFSPVSILGVTESISEPIHLSPRHFMFEPEGNHDSTHLSGNIVGRSWPGSVLELSGPGLRAVSLDVHGFAADVDLSRNRSHVRLLASEWDSYDDDATPLNAVWIDAPEMDSESLDIELPTPAREVRRTDHALELPSSGPVVGADLVPSSPSLWRVEDDYRYKVGYAWLEPTEDASRFSWAIRAFTGDMAPSESRIDLVSAAVGNVSQGVIAEIDPSTEESVTIPPAEVLATSGTTLDELAVAWSAPAYSHAGASIVAWDGNAAWYVYTFAGSESEMRSWPRLPAGVSREDVGFGSDDFRVNVFALTQDGVPWDWARLRNQRAVVSATRLPPEPSPPAAEPDRTGPFNAYDGIYTLSDVTENDASCSEEGPSIRDEYYSDDFVVVGDFAGLHISACRDVDDCRDVAAAFWESVVGPAEWRLETNFPGSTRPDKTSFSSMSNDDALCTGWRLNTTTATGVAGEHLRLDIRAVDIPAFAREGAQCSPVLAQAAADGLPCSSLRVLTGDLIERL